MDRSGFLIRKLEDPAFGVLAASSCTTCHLQVLIGTEHSSATAIAGLFVGGEHDRLGWHIDAHCEGFGRKQDLEETLAEQNLHDFAKHGKHSGVVLRHALGQEAQELVICGQSLQILLLVQVEAHNVSNGCRI